MKTKKGLWLPLLQLTLLMFITAAASAQLKADFSATPKSGCAPMVVSFKDSSSGNPDYWKWDLGNGTVSYLQNPIATYFNPGTYNVKLFVSNVLGKDSIVKNQYIVVNAAPVPAFGVSDTTGCFPLKVRFKDSTVAGSGRVTSWQWDFGDGTLSTDSNPTHIYTSAGIFTVILRANNSNGCSGVVTKPALIKIKNGVDADFSYSSLQGCHTPAPVNFTNKTNGTGTITYMWDFGDGQTSTLTDPVNSYVGGGVYTVKLIAVSSFGCSDTMIKQNAINVGFVHADFTKADTVCVGSALQLTNTSNPSTYTGASWDFGDSTSSTDINPAKTYLTAGVYNIKLLADFGSCRDSAIKSVTVLPKPDVSFTATNTAGCAAPLTVSYQNTSANGVSYKWSFGDGTTSLLQNPVHTYTSAGNFAVSLTVTNANGCSNTVAKDTLVKITSLKITAISNLGVRGCLPLTVSPVASIQDSLPIATYAWDFGDGATSTSATPTHTYTTTGVFDVKLTVTTAEGCTASIVLTKAVQTGNKPATQFSAIPTDVCAITPVSFTDLTTAGSANEWLWYFGDGGTSSQQNPVYTYNDTGYFNVTLITSFNGCPDTLKVLKYIHVRPPIAKFDTAFLCSDPFTRNFINNSIGATSYTWDFGDGTTSTAQQPSHTYAGPGIYLVVLKATNGQCDHFAKKTVVVVKEQGTLSISNIASCLNTRITYNIGNINASNISTYTWYFNGIPGAPIETVNNPVAWSFNTPGTRNTVVILKDILQCKDTVYATVPVNSYGPIAAFASSNPNTCFGSTVNFTDTSKTDGIHPITSYLWNYGEGNSVNYATGPFSHDYSALGTYNVKLVISDTYGCKDSITKPLYVSITKPVAAFTPSDTVLCPALPITFANKSTGVNATYNWDFGDGANSTAFSPVHSFTQPGSYNVKMLMIDKNGCSDSASTVINVYTAKADFSLSDSFTTCPPLVVNITNKSANFININWDFGDGGNSQLNDPSHIYTYPGNYTVKLWVKNNGGCIDTLTKGVVIQGPTGTFDYVPKEACKPGKVDYKLTAQNAVNFIWDFNDGTTIFTPVPEVTHTYAASGIYLPKIILEDAKGCKVPITGLDTIKVHSITANMASSTKMLCDSGYISFKDSSVSDDVINQYLWKFSDGTTSTQKNPVHSFANTGFYSVTLTATTRFGCIDSTVAVNYVKVVNSPAIQMLGDTSACEPAIIKLNGDFVRTDTSAVTWVWDFGNGQVSNQQQPDSQAYTNAGSYLVTLKATNSDGCTDVVTRTAVIHPKPAVDAGPNVTVCRFSPYTLQATGADSYIWKSDPSLSCTSCDAPVANPKDSVTYYVTGKTLFGCTNEDSVTIKVQQPFTMAVDKVDTLCKGESILLKATGADLYQWSPSLWLNSSTASTVSAKPDTTITYQVIGTDSLGCFKDTGNVKLKVYPVPTVEIINGDNVTMQVGSSIQLTTKSSADVIGYKWFPGQWLSCGSCAQPEAAPRDNITYSVTATNAGNCSARDQVTINLICDNANVYIPNTFSPNGDGVNDVFYPRGTGLYNILTFKVFNRWGQIVFERNGISANNASDGWDGTLKGLPLQSDIYVYVLEVVCSNNIIFPFKGNVALIR